MRSPQLPIRASRRLFAFSLVAALVPTVPAPGPADPARPAPAAATAPAAGTAGSVPPLGEAAASAAARRGGGPVEVTARRTATSEVYANADGTFTWRQHLLPTDGSAGTTGSAATAATDPVYPDGHKNHWAVAYKQSGCASCDDTAYYDGVNKIGQESPPQARVGYEQDTGGTARAYFEMNTRGLEGARIISATFNVFNTYSYSCTKTPVEFGVTGPISSSTTWNRQPTWKATLATLTFAHGWSTTSCGPAGEDFTGTALRDAVQEVATARGTSITFGLRSRQDYETNTLSWKRFRVDATNPVLEVTYNHAPTLTATTAYLGAWTNGSGDSPLPCDANPDTWPAVGASGTTLTATGTDADNQQLSTVFTVTEYGGATLATRTVSTASGVTAATTLTVGTGADQLQAGRRYTWTARTGDGSETSAPSAPCGFTVDATPPAPVTVASADGHALDVGEVPARQARTVRLSSGGADLSGFCWALNRGVSAGGPTVCADGGWAPAQADGTATITIYPTRWPSNTLNVVAYDRARNTAAISSPVETLPAVFVAESAGPAVADRRGDFTGDGQVDLLATTSAGTLLLYPGNGDGTVQEARQVGSSGWADALVAHGGDFLGPEPGMAKDGYEDLVVRLRDNNLYLYPGDGLGRVLSGASRRQLIHPGGTNWAAVTQLAAPGDVDGAPGNDVLAVEGGNLLLYSGGAAGGLAVDGAGVVRPGRTLLTGWTGWDLLVPGDITGDGVTDVLGRKHTDTTTDAAYGRLYLFRGVRDAAGTYGLAASTVYHASGWAPAARPSLGGVGNAQGVVVDQAGGTLQYQPGAGQATPDLWSTVPGGTAGTGQLYFHAGSPTSAGTGTKVGDGGWTSSVTRIS